MVWKLYFYYQFIFERTKCDFLHSIKNSNKSTLFYTPWWYHFECFFNMCVSEEHFCFELTKKRRHVFRSHCMSNRNNYIEGRSIKMWRRTCSWCLCIFIMNCANKQIASIRWAGVQKNKNKINQWTFCRNYWTLLKDKL